MTGPENFMMVTALPNVTLVVPVKGSPFPVQGAYLWPNGWLTVYEDKRQVNMGTIYPPTSIERVEFGP